MKYFIFLILICPTIGLCQPYYELTHYDIANSHLSVKYLGGDNFILFGTAGGVLRSYNSGQNWEQTYSGTHNSISGLIKVDNTLFAITNAGEFMTSLDGGDNWTVKKIADKMLTGLSYENGKILVSQYVDSIMISTDLGKTWASQFATNDTLMNAYLYSDNLILQTKKQGLLTYSDKYWEPLHLPSIVPNGYPHFITTNNKKIYLIYNGSVSILNEDLSWTTYDINLSISGVKKIIDSKQQIIVFKPDIDNNRTIVEYYNKADNSLAKREYIKDDNISMFNLNIIGADIDDGGNIVATGIGKTIFYKNNVKKDWETLSSYISTIWERVTSSHYFTEKEWRFTTSDGNFMWTNDGGTTFHQGNPFPKDTIAPDKIADVTYFNLLYITKDSINVAIPNYKYNFAYSNNAGQNFKFSNINSLYTTSSLFHRTANYNIYSLTQYRNQDLNHPYVTFFKESNKGTVDTLFALDSIFIRKSLNYKNKILIVEDRNKDNEFKFLLTDENFKNPQEVGIFKVSYDQEVSRPPSLKDIWIDKDDNLFILIDKWPYGKDHKNLISYTSIYKITNFEVEPELVFGESPVYFYLPDNYIIGDTNRLVTIGIINKDSNGVDYYYAKINISDGFNYKIVGKCATDDYNEIEYTLDNGTMLFKSNSYKIWRPIEAGRIKSNIENEPIPPAIWTYSPYPNPANNIVNVAFYSGTMSDIMRLQVKIINIGTGVAKKIEPKSITHQSNWNGIVELDLSSFGIGSYLLEFTLNNKKTIEKLIISR